MKVLVVAPHADDEILATGGTIYKYIELNDEVTVCIATQPWEPAWNKVYIKNRREEIADVHMILECDYRNIGYKAGMLDEKPEFALNQALNRIINEEAPDIVFIPSLHDLSKDHRIVHDACMQVFKTWFATDIFEYEVLSETPFFKPNYYVLLTDEQLKIKLDAMKAYKSELRKYPHPRSLEAIKALTMKRGNEVGVKYAEAFKLIRKVV